MFLFLSNGDNFTFENTNEILPGHAGHDASSLDVSAAGVVGDPLSNHHDGLVDGALRLISEPNDASLVPRLVVGAAVDGGEARVLLLQGLVALDDLDFDVGALERIDHVLGNPIDTKPLLGSSFDESFVKIKQLYTLAFYT